MGDGGRYRALTEFLSLFPRASKTGDGYNVPCPTGAHAHGDRKPSLHVSEHEGKILLHCHTGCATDSILAALNLTATDLYLSRNGHAPVPAPRPASKIVAVYDYTDADGQLLYQTVRYEPKDFRQRRPGPEPGSWLWNLTGIETVLYRLPAVLAAIAAHQPVYVVEGEKDANTLVARGLCATTSPMGAGKWRRAYSDSLRGADVAIIPDSDPPGVAHGEAIRASVTGVAASVRLLRMPTGRGKDITDYLEAGGDMAGLVEMTPAPICTRPDGILAMMGGDEGEAGASDPAVSPEIDGLSLTWGPEHVRAEITRLYQHHNGDVACELLVTYTLPGEAPRYLLRHHVSDLANATGRDRLAKLLSRHKGPDWPGMVHQVSEYTLSHMRQCPLAETMTDFSLVHAPEWILYPFLRRNENNLLFAPGKSGKSYLALLWLILMESHCDHNLNWIARDEPIVGVYFDWERSRETHGYRFAQILLGLHLPTIDPPAPFNYHKFSGVPLSREIRNAQALINQYGANFVICDSAGMAAGGDLNASEPAIEYFGALGQLHAADGGPLRGTLTLAHTAKNAEGKRSAYGNAYWTNEPSSVWEILPVEPGLMTLHQSSTNDDGHRDDIGLSVAFRGGDEGTVYSLADMPAKNLPGAGHEGRILAVLSSPRGPSEISRVTGLDVNIVGVLLSRMAKDGSVRHTGRGLWERGEP